MSKYIYRNVETTICDCIRVNDNADVEEFTDHIRGHVKTPDIATRRLRKRYSDQSITVRKIHYSNTRHRMTVEDFVKYGTEMTKEQ